MRHAEQYQQATECTGLDRLTDKDDEAGFRLNITRSIPLAFLSGPDRMFPGDLLTSNWSNGIHDIHRSRTCVGGVLTFLFRLVVLSVIALPVMADEMGRGNLGSARTTDFDAPQGGPISIDEQIHLDGLDLLLAEAMPPLAVPPVAATESVPIPVPDLSAGSMAGTERLPFIGDASAPNYWLVSSRCSAQHVNDMGRGPWGLDVLQRTPDLQMHRTDLPSLTSQLVPGVPVCIYVHGSFVEWESQCREAHNAYMHLRSASGGAPLQMIFFNWPSDGPYTYLPTIDVGVRGRQAEFNGFHLAWLISQIPESCPVCLIGHSHGARVVFSAMHLAGGGAIQGYVFPYSMGAQRRYRVVLAAAAMDHHFLNPGNRYGCALNRVECVLNLRNRHDIALTVYPLHRPFARRAFGKSGLTQRDAQAMGWNAMKIREYDVTPYLGHLHYWPEYYSRPAILAAIIPYAHFY